MSERKTKQCYSDMKQRCLNDKHKQFKNYGGRGITICARWLESYEFFISDMGIKPDGKTLDRKNNDGPYSPENCRWATPAEQRVNQRSCVFLEMNGKRLTVEEWGRELGRHPTTIRSRLRRGWKLEDVLTPYLQRRGRCSAPREYAAMQEGKP